MTRTLTWRRGGVEGFLGVLRVQTPFGASSWARTGLDAMQVMRTNMLNKLFEE